MTKKPNLSEQLIEIHRTLQKTYDLGYKAGYKKQKEEKYKIPSVEVRINPDTGKCYFLKDDGTELL